MTDTTVEDAFEAGIRAIAKIIISTPTEQQNFIKSLKWHLIQETLKMHPGASDSRISSLTGIPRSKIPKIKNEEKPKLSKGKEAVILSDLMKVKNRNNMVPLKGKNSFYSEAEKTLTSSYSVTLSLNNLIKSGNIVLHDDEDMVEIISESYNASKDLSATLGILGRTVNRLIETGFSNLGETDKSKVKYQNTVWSTKVSPNAVQTHAHPEIKKYINEITIKDIQGIVDKYEQNVPEYTYPEYGISLLEFYKHN